MIKSLPFLAWMQAEDFFGYINYINSELAAR